MKIEKTLALALCTSIALATLACGNPFGDKASVVDANHQPGITTVHELAPTRGAEFVAASQRGTMTSGGRFKVDATLSSPASGVELVTATRRYRVFSNVQGEFISSSLCSEGGSGCDSQ